jgi:hypothetical protein
VAGVARLDVKVNRIRDAYPLDDNWLGVNDSGTRKVADINATIETRLSDIDRDTNVLGCRRTDISGDADKRSNKRYELPVHKEFLLS